MNTQRCSNDANWLSFSYIAVNGITVYKCTQEDRHFLTTALGPVEVNPKKAGKGWTYEITDLERRRLEQDAAKLDEELDKRSKVYAKANLRYERDTEERNKYDAEIS